MISKIINDETVKKLLYINYPLKSINEPLCFHTFKMFDNYELLLKNYKNDYYLNKYSKDCYYEYINYKKNLKNQEIDTIDDNSYVWTYIFYSAFVKAKENNDTLFIVPNGCCNNKYCEIKIFYEILYKYMCNIK